MWWFRKGAARDPLAVAMVGVKLGDRFLSVGARDTALIAALAARSGLTGRACVVDADAARASGAAAAIEAAGALAEAAHAPWDGLPYEAGSFDVALVRDVFSTLTPDQKTHCSAEILRVLRGGGRVIAIEDVKRTRIASDALTLPLQHAGFAAVRVLAAAGHLIFVEGIKKA